MACGRFSDAIRASAHGAPLRADAAAHLAVCAECRATLDAEARVLAVIDTTLEELRSAHPSANFAPRVRARVAAAPRWTAGAWWMPAAAAALVLLATAVIVTRVPRERAAVHEAAASRDAGVPLPAPARATVEPSRRPARPLELAPPATATRVRVRPPLSEPVQRAQLAEVLVPEQQREAMSRLFAALQAGRPEVVSMLMNLERGDPGAGVPGVTIEPLRIDPVVVSALPSSALILDK